MKTFNEFSIRLTESEVYLNEDKAFKNAGQEKVFKEFEKKDAFNLDLLQDSLKKEYPNKSTSELIKMAQEISDKLELTNKFKV